MSRSAAEFQAFLELQRQEYRDALPEKVNAMNDLWRLAQQQPDLLGDLERRAHGMAGTAGTLGLGALGDLARALELAVRHGMDAGCMTPASRADVSAALDALRVGLPPPTQRPGSPAEGGGHA